MLTFSLFWKTLTAWSHCSTESWFKDWSQLLKPLLVSTSQRRTRKKLNQGTVVAAGPGVTDPTTGKLIPVAVKAGDKVLLPNFGGSSVKVGEEEYLLYTDREILAKIEN